jgi:hypothetical protein
VAMGYSTTASGDYSNAMGRNTIASGKFSSASGFYTIAPSYLETVIGRYNSEYSPNDPNGWIDTDRLFVIGNGTSSSLRNNALTILKNGNAGIGTENPTALLHTYGIELGQGNVVFVGEAKADEFAEYGAPPISGGGTRMMWYPDKAAFRAGSVVDTQWDIENIGFYSVAFGASSKASGLMSSAFGGGTIASGYFSSSFGRFTEASGISSTAFGILTISSGSSSIATGDGTIASGYASTAMGRKTTSPSAYETAIGSFNLPYTPSMPDAWFGTDRLFVIGNGSSSSSPSNAMTVLKNGNTGIGADNPVHKLDVKGNSRIQLTNNNETAWLAMRTDGDLLDFSFSGAALNIQGMQDGENILLNPFKTSKVGIRTWVPEYDLDVNGSFRANVMNITGQASITEKMVIGSTTQKGRLFLANADGAGNAFNIGTSEGDFANFYFLSSGLIFDCYRASDERRQPILLQPNGGRVGIGTIDPTALLHVKGNSRIQLTNDNETAWLAMRTDGDLLDFSFSGTALTIQGMLDGENIFLNPVRNSKVGIRTWVPEYDLDVNGSFRANVMNITGQASITERMVIGGTTQTGRLLVDNADGASNALRIGTSEGDFANLYFLSSGLIFDSYRASDERRLPILLQPSGGKVGIGTMNPEALLHVKGNSRIQLTNNNETAWLAMRTDGDLLDFSFSGAALTIQGMLDGENIFLNPVRNSKVGIRTWVPEYDLDVNGSFRARGLTLQDGSQGAGKVLTSDANGLASWQTTEANLTLPWSGDCASEESAFSINQSGLGNGIYVYNPNTSGSITGIEASFNSTTGTGIASYAHAGSGIATGILGQTASSQGIGVKGKATHYGGENFGVYGESSSYNGTGVFGYCSSTTGYTFGVYGTVLSPSGYSGFFGGGRFYVGGNVGLGTYEPSQKLHIKGSASGDAVLFIEPSKWNAIGDYGELRFGDVNHYIRGEYSKGMTFFDTDKFSFIGSNVGIGTSAPAYKLDVFGNTRIQLSKTNGEWIAMRTDGSLLDFSFSGNNLAIQGSNDGENIVLNPTRLSKVGIRMWIPMYDLDVNGNIRATGSVYYGGTAGSANGTAYTKPDYVFEESYDALDPFEVEEFLLKEKHLPWITSAEQEKQENGEVIDMTRMAFETVETVENLQLQIIEQNKLILELKSENEELKQNSSQLNARLERLEQALESLKER